jgi:hypothetical protein
MAEVKKKDSGAIVTQCGDVTITSYPPTVTILQTEEVENEAPEVDEEG